jgi:MerR family transcriptional regulator, copper efflux regulator
MMANLKIGALAERAGTNAPTIRYYEEIGLLRTADRLAGGQRTYGEADVKRLTFIRRCRDFGFSIEQVKSLVTLVENRDRSCMDARDLAVQHLATVRAKLTELKALERGIAGFVSDCDASCAGGPGPDCVILEDLSRTPEIAKSRPSRVKVAEGKRLAHNRAPAKKRNGLSGKV